MPTTFVTLLYKDTKKYVFCLPGNPVSTNVCTHLFLLPFLRSISGRKSITHSYKAKVNLCKIYLPYNSLKHKFVYSWHIVSMIWMLDLNSEEHYSLMKMENLMCLVWVRIL